MPITSTRRHSASPVLAHRPGRQHLALIGEREPPVGLDQQQAVALHPGYRLTDRGAALGQPLGDPSARRNNALLGQLKDRPEVHLRRVDQTVRSHRVPLRRRGFQGVIPLSQHRQLLMLRLHGTNAYPPHLHQYQKLRGEPLDYPVLAGVFG